MFFDESRRSASILASSSSSSFRYALQTHDRPAISIRSRASKTGGSQMLDRMKDTSAMRQEQEHRPSKYRVSSHASRACFVITSSRQSILPISFASCSWEPPRRLPIFIALTPSLRQDARRKGGCVAVPPGGMLEWTTACSGHLQHIRASSAQYRSHSLWQQNGPRDGQARKRQARSQTLRHLSGAGRCHP